MLHKWAWLWRILAVAVVVAALFIALRGWYNATKELAQATEANGSLRGELLAVGANATKLKAERAEVLDQFAGLRERYAALEAKAGRLEVLAAARIRTGGTVAAGAPRDEGPGVVEGCAPANIASAPDGATPTERAETSARVLLREGDPVHIEIGHLTLGTKGGNEVMLIGAQCWRDGPGHPDPIIIDVAEADVSEWFKKPEPKEPGVGIGVIASFGKHGALYGPIVSPASFNLWRFNFEVLGAIQANAAGDWQASAAALGRFR